MEMEDNDTNSSTEMWESPLGQSTYMFIWALASLASFAIFFKYF
ncbi:MAG: hypothetical protein VX626_01300 [Candidatus Thermoplasmatota archaeon]|nr:hypothetical protein [Candidatus Thermoplasmatota archaeon]